jgi:secreted trypsin-like serine protease
MRFFIHQLAVAFCEARPSDQMARAALHEIGTGSFIVGGSEAPVGEYPWQLSQERLGGAWSHSCGASLLGVTRGLSASHCVQGANSNILRIIAGLHSRSNQAGAQISNLASYVLHEQYNQGAETFNNDIAILNFATAIVLGGNVAVATLPPNDDNSFAGDTCIISGWGRTGAPNTLPDTLQHVNIGVISQIECNARMSPVSGALTGPGQICLFDNNQVAGSCNGDSGGPLNCRLNGEMVVAGVTSWGIQGGGVCLQTYPSVYSRTSYFLDWINSH